MTPAIAVAPPARSVDLPSVRLLGVLGTLIAGSWALVGRFEDGIAGVLVAWLVAAPLCLGPLRPAWRAELPGAICFFALAGSVYYLDERLGSRYAVVFLAALAVGAVYLMQRPAETRRLVRSPIFVALGAVVALQIVSAVVCESPDLRHIVEARATVLLFVLSAAVLARRPAGRWLLPMLLMLGTLASLPVMLRELSDPFPGSDGRAGGLYAQPNIAGIMLSFGVAAAAALHVEGLLAGAALAPLLVAFFVGLLATASRGALVNALAALAVAFAGPLLARRGRRGLAIAAAAVAALLLLQGPISTALSRASDALSSIGFVNAERQEETVLALSGDADATDDLMKADSHRLALVDEALARIARRPLFGYGTGAFMQDARRSHVEFLEIVGENGLVGAALYLVLLAVVARALGRMPARPRLGAAILVAPWLVTHFHNHNLLEEAQLDVALAYVVALSDRYPAPA